MSILHELTDAMAVQVHTLAPGGVVHIDICIPASYHLVMTMQAHILCASGAGFVICPVAPFGSVWPVEAVQKLHQGASSAQSRAQATVWVQQVCFVDGVKSGIL